MANLPHWPIPGTFGNKKINPLNIFERMKLVLEKLGNPHLNLPPVIHIAGTNGKGSVAQFLNNYLLNCNLKTGLYISPHIFKSNERITLNGEIISDNFLYEIMEKVRLHDDEKNLTFMESFTIGAFLAFIESDLDIIVLETGMGGKLDATNIVENKIATILTSISLDHTEYLGEKVEEIAIEKSLIMRKNTPMISAKQEYGNVDKIIDLLCKDQEIPIYSYGDFYKINIKEDESFDFILKGKIFNFPKPLMNGKHQYFNIATAIAAIFALHEHYQIEVDINAIKDSILKTSNHGRLQRVYGRLEQFIDKNSEIWIDGAHNIDGARLLAEWIKKEQQKEQKENILIVGFTKNKCKTQFIAQFENIIDKIYAIKVEGEPSPESPEIILEKINNINKDKKDNLHDVLIDLQNKKNLRIVICGSLYLAIDVKNYS